jgi:hypothetical protein
MKIVKVPGAADALRGKFSIKERGIVDPLELTNLI